MRDLKRLFGYLGPYRRDMFIGMALVFVETVFELIIPVLMAQLIDEGVRLGNISYILSSFSHQKSSAFIFDSSVLFSRKRTSIHISYHLYG